MRTRWAVLAVAVVMTCTLSAFASGPQIGIGDPTCPSSSSGFTQLLNIPPDPFTIAPNPSGGGYFGICNKTGTIWHTIDLFDPGTVAPNCYFIGTPTEFTSCVVNGGSGNFNIHLSGGTGLQPCSTEDEGGEDRDSPSRRTPSTNCLLIIDLNDTQGSTDPNGTGSFTAPLTGRVNAPEPTTMALLSAGLLGLWQYRRRRQ